MYKKGMKEAVVGPFRVETMSLPCHRRYRQPRRDVLDAMPRSSRSSLGTEVCWLVCNLGTGAACLCVSFRQLPRLRVSSVSVLRVCGPFLRVLAATGSRPNDSAQKPRTKRKAGMVCSCPRRVALLAKRAGPHITLSERCDWLVVRDLGERSRTGPVASAVLAWAWPPHTPMLFPSCALSRDALCTFPFCDNALLRSLR